MVVEDFLLTSNLQFRFSNNPLVLKRNFKIAVNKNCSATIWVTLYIYRRNGRNIFELGSHQERLWDNDRVNLVVQEIPVDYEFVQQNVPRIWTGEDAAAGDGNGVLALIHVGVSGIASKITIETKVGPFFDTMCTEIG